MAGSSARGRIVLAVDDQEIEAKLQFEPQADGQEWTVETLLKFLAEQRLTPPPSARTLDELLQKFSKAKQASEAVVARGVAALAPTPETAVWAEFPIPEDLAAVAKEIVERAAAPELYRIRIDKVKKETVVKKPAALPFLPPKEEIVVAWDKTETRERVFADPTVRELGYALAGTRVGTVHPPKPGKPGKTVFGRTVNLTIDPEAGFWPGAGIVRDKNEIKAEYSGVLRIGDCWGDVVPLARPEWSVAFGADSATVGLDFKPGEKRLPLPEAAAIRLAALDLGVEDASLIDEAAIAEAVERAARQNEKLAAFPLSKAQAAEARVDLSPDKLKATLYLRKSRAGEAPLTPKAAADAIRNSGVRGFKAEQVKADLLAFFAGTADELKDYPLVEGRAPGRGKDQEVQTAVGYLAEVPKLEILGRLAGKDAPAAGEFPAAEADDLAYVQRESPVAVISQNPAGPPGQDVFGAALAGLAGNDPEIKLSAGLRIARKSVVADVDGLLLVKHSPGHYAARIVPYRDCRIAVEVDGDAMSARLALEKEIGAGKPLNAAAVAAALEDERVFRGLDQAAVAACLQRALDSGAAEAVVARGEAPVAGGGSAVHWLLELASGQAVTLTDDGTADFKRQDRITVVAADQPVLDLVRTGADGRDGFNVLGKTLPAERGSQETVEHDDSLREEPIDSGVRLVAVKAGELLFDGKTVKVNSVHNVKGDVGLATGSIKFLGEVRVSGSVGAGFAVMGGGDVLIGGAAEAALVSAGGKASIGQGIIGGGKGIVRARAGIQAGFAEAATLLAVEDIMLKNGCLQCQVKTNGKLKLMGERGRLIGGFCRARNGVEAAAVGSERGIRTEISFGQDYLIMDQIEAIEREAEKAKAALVELDRRLKALAPDSPALEAVRAQKVAAMKAAEKHGLRLFTLRERFEEHHPSEIRVRGAVHPGVVLESHGRYFEVKQKRTGVVFTFDQAVGRIVEQPIK